jgi:hypothetical protein
LASHWPATSWLRDAARAAWQSCSILTE